MKSPQTLTAQRIEQALSSSDSETVRLACDYLEAESHRSGIREPPDIFEGKKSLDGRNRYLACGKLGIEPRFSDVSPDDPVAYVLSQNLHRRHLDVGQRALIADKAQDYYEKAAKERQRQHGGTAPGREKTLQENLPEVFPNREQARDQLAKTVGVSGRTVDNARTVRRHGTPELIKAVEEGRMAVTTAARFVHRAIAV